MVIIQIGALVTGRGWKNDLDDICSTRDTVVVRICVRLRNGRTHTHIASPGSNCAGSGPLAETLTVAYDL